MRSQDPAHPLPNARIKYICRSQVKGGSKAHVAYFYRWRPANLSVTVTLHPGLGSTEKGINNDENEERKLSTTSQRRRTRGVYSIKDRFRPSKHGHYHEVHHKSIAKRKEPARQRRYDGRRHERGTERATVTRRKRRER